MMNTSNSVRSFRKWTMLMAASLIACSVAMATETASATVSYSQLNPTTYQYNVTLTDTGTTDVGTLWFGWVPGENFMPVSPSSVSAPSSWTDTITHGGPSDGYAVRWIAGGSAALTPGESLPGFSFDSTATPAELAGTSPFHSGTPVETSFIYSGAPFSDAGYQFVAGGPAKVAAPEPGGFALIGLGLGLITISARRIIRRR